MAVRQRTSRGYFFNVALLTFAVQAAPVGSWQAEVSDAPELDAGFRLLYEMKPADARAKFAAWQTSHPQDPLGSAAEAASYLFEECYRQGVLTSEFFLDDRRFLGKIAIKPDQEVRDAFFAAELRAQDRRRKDLPQQLMSNLADGFLCPPPVELLGATVPICDDVVHATHENAVVREIEEARLLNAELLRTGRWDGELVHTKADGTEVVMASRWSLQRDDRQRPLAILELDSDITERKRAEEKLRQSEAYLSEAD